MPCVKRCCCCVTLRLGGITMGIMTLALSALSIIPMTISFVHRLFLARVVTHLLSEFRKDKEEQAGKNFFLCQMENVLRALFCDCRWQKIPRAVCGVLGCREQCIIQWGTIQFASRRWWPSCLLGQCYVLFLYCLYYSPIALFDLQHFAYYRRCQGMLLLRKLKRYTHATSIFFIGQEVALAALDHCYLSGPFGVFGWSHHFHHPHWEPLRDPASLGLCHSRGRYWLLFMGLHREPFSGE